MDNKNTPKSRYEINAEILKFLRGEVEKVNFEELVDDLLGIPPGALLPEILIKEMPRPFNFVDELAGSAREKDILFLGLISALGALFHEVTGEYRGRKYHCNLNLIVLAPPAMGKGALKIALALFKRLDEESLVAYKKAKNGFVAGEVPKVPLPKTYYIPGDASGAALKKKLKINDGTGFMLETEIDTVTQAMGQDWGGFSDILRATFEHEDISKLRMNDEDPEIISNPRFGTALSGTPGQMKGLVKSILDGLFSRLLFYHVFETPKWQRWEKLSNQQSFEDMKKRLRDEGYDLSKQVDARKIDFEHTEIMECVNFVGEKLTEEYTLVNKVFAGNVFRSMVMVIKVAMIFHVLRILSKGEELDSRELLRDVVLAMYIVGLGLVNARYEARELAPATIVDYRDVYLEKLPAKFQTVEAVQIGKKMQIPTRTIHLRLQEAVKQGKLIKVAKGIYQKPE